MSIKDSKAKRKSPALKIVLDYVERLKWAVLPIYAVDEHRICTCKLRESCPKNNQGKHPITPNGVLGASKDPAQIRQWFKQYPGCNWAVATGAISGITAVDVDMGKGKVGYETFAALKGDQPDPQTLTAKTGGGGLHYVFQHCADLKSGNDRLGTHVDVKNDGGYVLVAPSNHRSGGHYEWVDEAVPLGVVPDWLTVKKETRGRPKKGDERRKQWTLSEIASALKYVSSENRDLWRKVGLALGRAFHNTPQSDEAWTLYNDWSDTYTGEKNETHNKTMHEAFYVLSQVTTGKDVTVATIIHEAIKGGWAPKGGSIPLDEFVFDHEGNNFIYRSMNKPWLAASVNAACTSVNVDGKILKPSEWLMANCTITSTTSDPGIDGDILKGFNYREGHRIQSPGAATFNTYRPPNIELGDPDQAEPYVNHVNKVFPREGDAAQVLDYLAHRRQRPWEKPQYALVIGGGQGVGKDTAVVMAIPALGGWNVKLVKPADLDQGFNTYASRVLVRISEVADQRDMSRWTFYERGKDLIAGSDEYVTINPKYGHQYAVRLHCGVIITTNHLAGGIYIPEEDRRYDVIDAATFEEMGLVDLKTRATYFTTLYEWFHDKGKNHIAAFLQNRDLSKFRATINRKTEAWRRVVQHGLSGYEWCADALESCTNQQMVSGSVLTNIAMGVPGAQHNDIIHRLPHALRGLNYVMHENPAVKDRRWKLDLSNPMLNGGKKCPPVWHRIYRKKDFHPDSGLGWQNLLDRERF